MDKLNSLSGWKWPLLEEVPPFPKYMMFDVTNICNAACSHCAHPLIRSEKGYRPAFLGLEAFKQTLEEVARYGIDLIRLTADGEPLLHPRITTFVSLARQLTGAAVNVTTNGSLLKGRLLERLLVDPPDVFDISLDAYDPATYEQVRKGLDFLEVKHHVRELCRLRDPEKTKIIVSMIHRPELEEETIKFQAYWDGLVDRVVIRHMHSNRGLSGRVAIPSSTIRWPCQHLWGRLIIDFHARIRYCPVDWRGESSLGRVGEVALRDVWEGKRLNDLRRQQLSGDFTGSDCCRNCRDWYTSPWDRGWLKLIDGMQGTRAVSGQHGGIR